MKKITASLLEVVHLAAAALILTLTAWIASIPGPLRAWSGSGFKESGAAGATVEIRDFLLLRGPWIAGIGLAALACAGVLRGEGKKIVPLTRLVATSATLLFSLWAALGLPAERLPHAWNCLFLSAALDVVCTALLVNPGKGGGKAKPAEGK